MSKICNVVEDLLIEFNGVSEDGQNMKGKMVNCMLEQAQRGSRSIALLLLSPQH